MVIVQHAVGDRHLGIPPAGIDGPPTLAAVVGEGAASDGERPIRDDGPPLKPAVLFWMVVLVGVGVPLLKFAPPSPPVAPSVSTMFCRVSVTPLLTTNRRLVLPPLSVMRLPPLIVVFVLMVFWWM